MQNKISSLEYTCLFGGGAIRGAAHVGALKALEELGVEINTFGGSSVGSIIAALRALGYSIEELAQIFLSVNFELFRDISLGFNTKFALSKGEVFLDWFRDLAERKFYGQNYVKGESPHIKFKDLKTNLIIISTDMKDFSCCEFSNYETPEFEVAMAVRISCCMPGLMRAVNIDNKLLVDGDLMKGKPMWSLSKNLKNSKNRILEIRLEGDFSGDDKNPLEYVNGMYSCMTYSETSFIKEIYGNCDKYDYLVLDTGNVIVVDFNYPPEKRQKIIDGGYQQTMEYFKKFLPAKKQKLLLNYSNILKSLKQILRQLEKSRYKQAKYTVAEMFILLSEIRNVIDSNIYEELSTVQKLIFSNVKFGLLGTSKCSNKKTIISVTQKLIYSLEQKIQDLKIYINDFSE